jgi:hypothetical protein
MRRVRAAKTKKRKRKARTKQSQAAHGEAPVRSDALRIDGSRERERRLTLSLPLR